MIKSKIQLLRGQIKKLSPFLGIILASLVITIFEAEELSLQSIIEIWIYPEINTTNFVLGVYLLIRGLSNYLDYRTEILKEKSTILTFHLYVEAIIKPGNKRKY